MDLKQIATHMMTNGIVISEILEHWDYRKGKNIEDLRKARTKAIKNGMRKFEYEIDMCELYLKDVLKKKTK